MEQPPPYRPKKSNTGLIVGLVIGGLVVCCIGPLLLLGGGVWWGMTKGGPVAKCAISMEAMQEAVLEYANANGGKLPDAAKWQDLVKPYYAKAIQKSDAKDNPFGVIPAEGEWGCTADDEVATGIAFNSDLSNKKLADIQDQSGTVMLFEMKQRRMNLSGKYDKSNLGDMPKRFGKPALFIATVSGHTKMIGPNGKEADMNIRMK
jgi:hypothetical protein